MRPWRIEDDPENGSASLEFLTAGMILLIPIIYLVITLSTLQSGALAVEGAARQAARVFVQAPTEQEARERAARAIGVGLSDYGLDGEDAVVSVHCASATGCLTRSGRVTVTVSIRVTLPLVPDVLSLQSAASVPIEAQATQTVSRFWGAR